MPQKTIPIAVVLKNATIDPMYSGGPKKRCNRRHIAAFFAPAAIVQISCSVKIIRIFNKILPKSQEVRCFKSIGINPRLCVN